MSLYAGESDSISHALPTVAVSSFDTNGISQKDANRVFGAVRSSLGQQDSLQEVSTLPDSGLRIDYLIKGSVKHSNFLGEDFYTLQLQLVKFADSSARISEEQELQGTLDQFILNVVPELVHKIAVQVKPVHLTVDSALPLATLDLQIEPADARVFLDSVQLADTVAYLRKLSAGRHLLRIERKDFEPWVDSLELVSGAITQKVVKLKKRLGTLNITLDQKAHIRVDGNEIGHALFLSTNFLPGIHDIQVFANGFEPVDDDVTIVAGEVIDRAYELHRSKQWKDSVANEHHFRIMLAPRIVAGTVFVVGAGYALMQALSVVDHRSKAQESLDAYASVVTNFASYKAAYQSEIDKEAQAKRKRNVGSIVALLGALGFGVTFAF